MLQYFIVRLLQECRRQQIEKEEYFDEWKEILDSYTDSNTIILFSSTTIEDRKTTEEFSKKYTWQKSCVSFPDTVDEYWSQLGRCRLCHFWKNACYDFSNATGMHLRAI